MFELLTMKKYGRVYMKVNGKLHPSATLRPGKEAGTDRSVGRFCRYGHEDKEQNCLPLPGIEGRSSVDRP